MSLSSKQPGVLLGWLAGRNATVRSNRSAKKFQRRLERRKGRQN